MQSSVIVCKDMVVSASSSVKIVEQQFVALYEKESNAVFRFCILRTSDREQALDLTQETFMRLWNSLRGDTQIENHRAFLFAIARNLIIDWYRKKKPVSLDAMMDQEEGGFEITDDSYTKIEQAAEAELLLKNINAIDPLLREAVYLRFVEDLSPTEIAEALNITANAASVRISRGVQQLKERKAYS